ncbi:TNF receptor-associated protein 1 homolog [Durusdinium trenchii]|uniref:Mitochondrial (TNFR-associated protein 1 homolog) (Trap1 homolog) n=1 Tax=Durusdinium trenchii TaxID=1381693 RepID=A0ABP0JCQ6_9DINO
MSLRSVSARSQISGVAPSRTPRWTRRRVRDRCVRSVWRSSRDVSGPVDRCRPFSTETHEFKAETKKLLDIVAKSLYTDKEVFIRELISNASDACEKLRFLQTTQQVKDVSDAERPLQVTLSVNESERKFVIEDSGIGMTHDELIEHLGTIAKSGSLDFLQRGESDASKIIGQFGVGFYSTFVVADKVEVYTKTADKEKGEKGYLWTSDGSGSFTITEVDEVPRGTKIELTLKDDATEFSKLATVKKAAQKFSSFIDFPIYVTEEGEPKPINKQEALWMKSSATEEQHLEFFRFLSGNSYGKPWYTLMYQTDAPLSIKSCFYIPDPDNAPSRMFTKDPEIGISLHSRRVMVKKHADGVIPKWLHWMKGIVDCEDMPMNISRESMQDTRLMEKLSMAVVRRILRFLQQEAKLDLDLVDVRCECGVGCVHVNAAGLIEDKEGNFSRHKDDLLKLLRFECSNKGKGELISLEEYIEMAKDGQQNIYYFTCPDRQTGLSSPYMEQLDLDKPEEPEDTDAWHCQATADLCNPSGSKMRKDKRVLTEEEQTQMQKFIKSVLKEKVQEVKFSDRLVSSPAIVWGARQRLQVILESNEPVARIAVEQLYDNACIAAGTLDDPRVLMSRLNKVLEMFVYQGAGYDYARDRRVNVSTARNLSR